MKKLPLLSIIFLTVLSCALPASVSLQKGINLTVVLGQQEADVVKTAFEIFSKDYARVFDAKISLDSDSGTVYIGTLGQGSAAEKLINTKESAELQSRKEGFIITVSNNNLIIVGSDKRGTAYGILELSRIIGVSPWEWWADSPINKKDSLKLDDGFRMLQSPSVAHRGIFINDEDWGMMPWSSKNYEPSNTKGQIGPKTHARIFELLLRLRANTFWPAMHNCSVAFYFTPGNKEMADKYGIYIGTSHCEPMLRNTNAEWKVAGKGAYNYLDNRNNVLRFWEARTKQSAGSDGIYTLGMRGIHDEPMEGAKTLEDQKNAMAKIIKDQRALIAKYVNPDVEKVSQIFVPYKEVLDIYNKGLEVPEDVTLLWCDDNYGYIRHFPTDAERARKGGNGVYYHVSYWGIPHDYLWLATNHPAQLYTQMKLAYDKGARHTWILNVGDIKPAEYLTELFLDMAWNIDGIENTREGLNKYLADWLSREFGSENAETLRDVMNEYYRLAYIRKPEFMGNTRVDEADPIHRVIKDFPWTKEEIYKRLKDYETIATIVKSISSSIPKNKRASWFELVEYPVLAAAEMNYKYLHAQLARHGIEDWSKSDNAHDEMAILTDKYNTIANGKWRFMMDHRPRRITVFKSIQHTQIDAPLITRVKPLAAFNGTEYNNYRGDQPISHGLGYESKAISLPKGSTVEYQFETTTAGSTQVETSVAPNHPVANNRLRYKIQIDDEPEQTIGCRTEGRSEEWKVNTLRNQVIRNTNHKVSKSGKHTLRITAVDEGIVVDQIKVSPIIKK